MTQQIIYPYKLYAYAGGDIFDEDGDIEGRDSWSLECKFTGSYRQDNDDRDWIHVIQHPKSGTLWMREPD